MEKNAGRIWFFSHLLIDMNKKEWVYSSDNAYARPSIQDYRPNNGCTIREKSEAICISQFAIAICDKSHRTCSTQTILYNDLIKQTSQFCGNSASHGKKVVKPLPLRERVCIRLSDKLLIRWSCCTLIWRRWVDNKTRHTSA